MTSLIRHLNSSPNGYNSVKREGILTILVLMSSK